jgi:hypothetical protein
MKSYIEVMLKEFPNANDQDEKLEKERMEIFHRFVAKGLFSLKQGRPDIMPGIAVEKPSNN